MKLQVLNSIAQQKLGDRIGLPKKAYSTESPQHLRVKSVSVCYNDKESPLRQNKEA